MIHRSPDSPLFNPFAAFRQSPLPPLSPFAEIRTRSLDLIDDLADPIRPESFLAQRSRVATDTEISADSRATNPLAFAFRSTSLSDEGRAVDAVSLEAR